MIWTFGIHRTNETLTGVRPPRYEHLKERLRPRCQFVAIRKRKSHPLNLGISSFIVCTGCIKRPAKNLAFSSPTAELEIISAYHFFNWPEDISIKSTIGFSDEKNVAG